jgi:NADH:ubiquinone oxidoreductase subunit E
MSEGRRGEPTGLSQGTSVPRQNGDFPHLPVDPSLTVGRAPDRDAEGIPELHEVGCPPELRRHIEELVGRYPDKRSASIPALWAVQRLYGWCTPDGIRQAAAVMGVTPAYLESVASFYDLLRTSPVGKHSILVCTNISCWMRGADEVLDHFSEACGIDSDDVRHGGANSDDGRFFLSGFECLGACDLAPMASIDDRYYGPLDRISTLTAIEQLLLDEEVLPDKALQKRKLRGGPDGEPDDRVAGKTGPNSDPENTGA